MKTLRQKEKIQILRSGKSENKLPIEMAITYTIGKKPTTWQVAITKVNYHLNGKLPIEMVSYQWDGKLPLTGRSEFR